MHSATDSKFSPRLGLLAASMAASLIACSSTGAGAQSDAIQTGGTQGVVRALPEQEQAAGLALTCEVYCSETKLRTAQAELRWKLVPGPALEQKRSGTLSTAAAQLQATVFKNGFEKDLFVSLPLSAATGEQRAVPSRALSKQSGQTGLRAYQFYLVEIEKSRSAEQFAAGAVEEIAVVEGLEPGVTYTWRIVVPAGAGELVSAVVTCQAPVCPADMVREDQ